MKVKFFVAAVSTFGLAAAAAQADEAMLLSHSNQILIAASADITTPSVDRHGIERPDVDEHGSNKPDVNKPDIDKAEIERPEMEKPEIDKPEMEKPEVEKPHVENH